MHYLYYVAIKKEKEQKKFRNLSLELRKQAQNILEQNNFASANGGYWSSSKADWFVIGGRWSGMLQSIKLKNFDKSVRELIQNKKKDKNNKLISDSEVKENAKEIRALS